MDFCEKWNDVNLRSLKIQFHQKSDNIDLIIPFLQQWLKRIKSVQALSLRLTPQSLGVLEDPQNFFYCLKDGEDVKLLKHLLICQNILKATTHLQLVCSESQASAEISRQILACCPKLASFSLRDVRNCEESPSLLVSTPFPSCLPPLKNMNDLRSLKVIVNKIWPFLRDFTLLPSIQDIQFEFLPFKKSIFASAKNASGQEELFPIFTDFCEKWNDASFKNLKILFNQTPDTCDLLIPLLQHWLKRIKSLQTLSIQLTPPKDSGVPKPAHKKKLDLSLFLNSIKHLGGTLESMSIIDGQLFYKIENPSEQLFAFDSLQELVLHGWMPQESQVSRLLESNLRDSITMENEKPLDISLKELTFDSMESFVSFVRIFDKANFVKRTLRIDVEAEIKLLPKIVDFSYSQTYTKSFKLYSRNVSIKFKVETKERFLEDDESKSEFTKLLQVLKFEEAPPSLFNYYRIIYL